MKEVNYRGLFLIGISQIAIGTSLIILQPRPVGIVFISIGGLFLIISLKNKERWKK